MVHTLLWLRIVPDMVFLFAGIVPLVAAACYGFLNLRRAELPAGQLIEELEASELAGKTR